MSEALTDTALGLMAQQIEARAITEQPLTIAEMHRLAVALRTVALVQAAHRAVDQVEEAEAILRPMIAPGAPGVVALPTRPAQANVLPFPRRHRVHGDVPDGAA